MKEKEIAALWSKTAKSGKEWFSGSLDVAKVIELAKGEGKIRVRAFISEDASEKQPKVKLYFDDWKPQQKQQQYEKVSKQASFDADSIPF